MQILVSVEGAIGRLRFNRPDARNALSKEMWLALPTLLDELTGQGARVIIISGEGGAFAAGADIGELRAVNDLSQAQALSLAIADGIEAVATTPAATIAMVDGHCLGGGCLIAAACDLRYASKKSTFAVPVAKLGIILDQTNIRRLSGLIGPGRTKEMLFAGATMDSTTAHGIGLLNGCFADTDKLSAAVFSQAEAIAANSLESILATKSTLAALDTDAANLPEALRAPSEREVAMSYFSPDLKARLSKMSAGT